MRRFPITLVLPLLLGALASPAAASDLSFVAGLAPMGDLTVDNGIMEFDRYGFLGVRYEKDYLLILGIEHNLVYANDLLAPRTGNGGEDALYYTGNLVLNLPVDRIVPNFVLGIGLMHRFGDSFPDTGSSFLTNWGLGVKFRELLGSAGLRFDLRRVRIHGVEDGSVTATELSGGLLLTF
jgi:hypothetical protein